MDSSTPHHSSAPVAAPPGVLRRAVAASAVGNASEWFDYGVYAFAIAYIEKNFFPGDNGKSTFYAPLVFAISFLVQPLGGLVWEPLGDRLGRRRILAMTILMMSGATFSVGLIPSYHAPQSPIASRRWPSVIRNSSGPAPRATCVEFLTRRSGRADPAAGA